MINIFTNSVLRDLRVQRYYFKRHVCRQSHRFDSNSKARTEDFMFSLLPIDGYILCVKFCVYILLFDLWYIAVWSSEILGLIFDIEN